MSRDIDQEVSDTLCTLLSFDEDNFLSQEEVEENLRNCPNIENDTMEKIYADYNSGNATSSRNNDTNYADMDVSEHLSQGENGEVGKLPNVPNDEVNQSSSSHNIYPSNGNELNAEKELDKINADHSEDTVNNVFKQPDEIKMEFICESEQITVEQLHLAHKPTAEEAINIKQPNNLKMEIACESEEITDPHIESEYCIEDPCKKDIHFHGGLTQVEIMLSSDKIEDNIIENELLDNILLNQDSSLSFPKECVVNADDDCELSSIMNDHNYTSQEHTTNSENLHKLLVNHILRKGSRTISVKYVNDFVDRTLESINTFTTESEDQLNSEDEHPQHTVGLIDIFAAGKSSKKALFDEGLKSLSHQCSSEKEISNNENTVKKHSPKTSAEYNGTTSGEEGSNVIEDTANKISNLSPGFENLNEGPHTDETGVKSHNTPVEFSSQEKVLDTLEYTARDGETEGGVEKKKNAKADTENMEVPKNGKSSLTELPNVEMTKEDNGCEEQNTNEPYSSNEESSKKSSAESTALKTLTSISQTEIASTSDIIDFKTFNLSSVPSPQENCSEPMEHTTFDEVFEINCNEKSTVINHLDSLLSFAKSLQNDCETFTSSTTTIENRLQKYMQEQFEIFKKIVISCAALRCVDKSIQTDNKLSKRKLRKLNQNNKKMLLDSSSTSDSSSSEISTKSKISRPFAKSSANNTVIDSATQIFSGKKTESLAAEYDDGVPLVEYTQSEIFETETFCESFTHIRKLKKNDSLSEGEESEADTWHRKKSNTHSQTERNGSQNESDKENSVHKNKNCRDEGDKEIERLINLNGLIKRSNLGSSKSTESNEKVKARSATSKNKEITDDYIDDDIHQDIISDASISESEEEIITEKQFLKRCNENVKQQLLSDSNSEFSQSDASDNIEEILSSSEGSNSPLVDRFLKKFNANESDEESEKCDKVNNKASIPQEVIDLKNSSIEKNKSNSSENSDCEVLDDMGSLTKQSKPKSLEKMLSVVEKRKKMSRLCDSISLSSESESSDVEAVDETKSRIKPMLRPEQLATVTREAQRNESERIRRLERKHKVLSKLLKERPDVQGDCNLILDYNEESKTFIKVHPDIVKYLKQHQRDGVKFMYDSCYGGVEALKKSAGSGCILAHCMGLGKTLQLIALLHTVISYKELKTSKVLVLCPKSTVMNWADEIERWLGPLKPKYYTFHDTSDINDKIQILKDWSSSTPNAAGILLIGYEAFRTLVFYHSYKNRSIAPSRLESIRNDVDKYLLSPGAHLVVCDEGHIIKNSKSAISLAVSQIKTPKRIVLTGTPIQNNLKEYYSMVNFIKPLFLGTEKEFANLYANPIKNGQHKDSSKRDIQVMKQRSFVLHKKLSKFVQRKEAELLKTFLPQKYEYVLFVPMTKVQTILYEYIINIISKKEDRGKGLITDYTCLRKIWTHPKVLEDAWKNATAQKHRKDPRKNQTVNSDDDQPDDVYDSQTGVISVTNDWWRSLLTEKDLETILPSNKLRTMFEILRMCEEKGEKCLIFSAFVAVLNVVEYFFKKMNDKDPDTLNELKMSQGYQVKNTWILGKDYYRLDGKTPKLIRHEMIEQFNSISNKRARVFLISSRAGGQGINLTGANRVIILDTSWNPSNDQQNIFRVFRLGQKKNCYIYRLLAMGTMEEKVYSRSVTKQAMSFRVVDEQQIDRHYSMAELTELYSLTLPDYENRPMPDCPQDSILASLILNYPQLVYKYHEHDSLLENKVEQELSEQEKQDAWAAYERDQQLNSEIREMPNPDDVQSNLSAPKFPSYLGSSLSAFNQMSALFNYGNYPPSALSSYLPYLSHLSNYSTSNQQYLEMRKRIAEGAFGYPDISTSLGSAAFSSPFAQNAPKSVSTNPLIPDLPIHSPALHTNPLSALGDLSMYGLGAANNHLAHNVNTSALPQRQHNSPTYPSPAASTANNMQANFDYQMYENSLKSLVNYRHDFSGNGNSLNKPKVSNTPVNAFRNPLFSPSVNMGYDKNALSSLNSPSPKAVEQQPPKQHTDKTSAKPSSDISLPLNASTRNDGVMNKSNFSVGNSVAARSSPLPQVAAKRTFPPDLVMSNATNLVEDRLTPNSKTTKDVQHSSMPNFQSYKGNSASSSGGIYSNKNTTGKTSSDNISTNSEMQIIPTNSPPGSTSVTKQFSEISPSISLTAVSNTNTSTSVNKSNFNQSKNQAKNASNSKIATSNNNAAESNTPSPSYTANKFFEMNKKPVNRPVLKPTPLTTKTKLASTSESILKSASPTPPQSSYQQSASDLGPKLLSAVAAKNKNIVHKKPQNLPMQQIKTNTQGRTPSTVTTAKTQNGTAKPTASKTVPQQNDARKPAISMEKRLSPIITSQSSSGVQVQKTPAGSGTVKIQPSSVKQSTASTNENMLTYILETCINQRKFAIGAPTKSGGGTTVTRVQAQGKRKGSDNISKDNGSNESKRAK
ncbi:transcriptional regulator ATRX-like isoform X1 [Anastrepha ludens]|uniref:transcriptional regulator ATRX-like isoform X1 n=1 Tax=Anastrepha ludens TaxID=28586 RepID=UPI0023AEDBE3|nr:transcriptional regulator ATRX-like isoform X1 [Anastrepha ludens]